MLQQTQVARVLDHFEPFMKRFPTPNDLARANEQTVLSAWAGLGYYRRARNLQAAARNITEHHRGIVPASPIALRALPGVGRYTAGAIASIVYNQPEPIVDGNVRRVILRIDGVDDPLPARELDDLAWRRAHHLVTRTDHPAILNEGLMELGAIICTPRSPSCNDCPVARACIARRQNLTDRIPPPKASPVSKPILHQAVALIRDSRGRTLLEQRPPGGLWPSLWQAPTLERDGGTAPIPAAHLRRALGVPRLSRAGSLTYQTTHREVRITIWTGTPDPDNPPRRGTFHTPAQLRKRPLSNLQKRILEDGTFER